MTNIYYIILLILILNSSCEMNSNHEQINNNVYDTICISNYGFLLKTNPIKSKDKIHFYKYQLRNNNYEKLILFNENKLLYVNSDKKNSEIFLDLNPKSDSLLSNKILIEKNLNLNLYYFISIDCLRFNGHYKKFIFNNEIMISSFYNNNIWVISGDGEIIDVGEYFITDSLPFIYTIKNNYPKELGNKINVAFLNYYKNICKKLK